MLHELRCGLGFDMLDLSTGPRARGRLGDTSTACDNTISFEILAELAIYVASGSSEVGSQPSRGGRPTVGCMGGLFAGRRFVSRVWQAHYLSG